MHDIDDKSDLIIDYDAAAGIVKLEPSKKSSKEIQIISNIAPKIKQIIYFDEHIGTKLAKIDLFLATCSGTIEGFDTDTKIGQSLQISSELLEPIGRVKAINSNFVHKTQVGFEHLKVKKKQKRAPQKRSEQGDGTCLNSSIQLSIQMKNKMYKPKLFPSKGGKIQIPGVLKPDLSDGMSVLKALIRYLDKMHAKYEVDTKCTIIDYKPTLLNYKTNVNLEPKQVVDVNILHEHISNMEKKRIPMCNIDSAEEQFDQQIQLLQPLIRETKIKEGKLSFKVNLGVKIVKAGKEQLKHPSVIIFQSGKINLLNSVSIYIKNLIYKFIDELFEDKWDEIICEIPDKD